MKKLVFFLIPCLFFFSCRTRNSHKIKKIYKNSSKPELSEKNETSTHKLEIISPKPKLPKQNDAKTLFVMTWNSEYSAGSKKTLATVKDKIENLEKKPEIIAICQQEATKDKKTKHTLGKRLAGELEHYDFIEEHKITGITKLIKGLNFTNITVLVKDEFADKIEKQKITKGKKSDPFRNTKGVTWVRLPYETDKGESSIVLGCAHVDASNHNKRTRSLDITVRGLEDSKSDNIILAGDLNYRTDPSSLGLLKKKKTTKVRGFVKKYLTGSKEGFFALLDANTSHEELKEKGFDCSGYKDPKITKQPYPPTYKFSYKIRKNKKSCEKYYDSVLKNSDEEKFKDARACYFGTKKGSETYVTVKKEELNIGYLDRICIKGPSSLKKISQGSLGIFESDHLPVWSVIEF